MSDVHREAFLSEAQELLADLESALLELEQQPRDAELIQRTFRALHTIKGSGAMFGFDEVAQVYAPCGNGVRSGAAWAARGYA